MLIACTAAIDYCAALWLEKIHHDGNGKALRRTILCISVCLNLSLLFYFKYVNFFLDNACLFLQSVGLHPHRHTLQVLLPLGISFYTFETISYIVDVFNGKTRACKSLLDYATFIMFFPHLIAGPIVRAHDFLPQLCRPKKCTWSNMCLGTELFILGLFKKVMIGDYLAQVADPVFQNPSGYDTGTLWIAALAYTGQIFCDFSGYSDMAIGLARMLGYKLQPNFNLPYLSVDIADFWRRWHISLSSWIRDYLYIPLGGSRTSPGRHYANLMITMLICGLWHGANWQFIAWGGYHGILLLTNHLLRRLGWKDNAFTKVITIPVTFTLVLLGWVMFRSATFPLALQFYSRMFSVCQGSMLSPYLLICALVCFTIFGASHILAPFVNRRRLFSLPPQAVALGLSAMLLCVLILRPEQRTQFIYFQF